MPEEEKTLTMPCLESLGQRICITNNASGRVEEVIRVILEENALNPKVEARRLPFDGFKTNITTDAVINFTQKEPRNLLGVLEQLCSEHNISLLCKDGTLILTA